LGCYVCYWRPLLSQHLERDAEKGSVLSPVRPEAPAALVFERAFQKIRVESLAGGLDYYSEHIDVTRFPDPAYQTALRGFLRSKYESEQPDLIVAASGTCVEFVARYGVEIFPGVPVVFVEGIVFVGKEGTHRLANATGVSAKVDLRTTLDLALRLQPGTRRVFVVSGLSEFDKYYETIARREFQEFEQRVGLTYLVGLPMTELQNNLANLPRDSIIYFLTVSEDGAGNRFLPTEALDKLSAVTNAPIYSWSEVTIDHGIVGGSLMSFELVAEEQRNWPFCVLRGKNRRPSPLLTFKRMSTCLTDASFVAGTSVNRVFRREASSASSNRSGTIQMANRWRHFAVHS
jgi:hypothetical protein